MSDEYRASFIEYWQRLGDKIGNPIAPIPVPSNATPAKTRAVKIRPEIVRRITPYDMNIVYERFVLPEEQRFDLVIGTNIFVYYGGFEQSLARANVAAMLKSGGFLISNDKLPDTVPSGLTDVLETPVVSSQQPLVKDVVFCYQRNQ